MAHAPDGTMPLRTSYVMSMTLVLLPGWGFYYYSEVKVTVSPLVHLGKCESG